MPRCFCTMLERYIAAVRSEHPGDENVAGTRERLRGAFAPGMTRRMTQLGLLVGAVVGPLEPGALDTIVYASSFGESRALEGYLESFPFPSPTLFQTSIHPSGVQQGLIGWQRSIRELWPVAAGPHLTAHALLTALLAPADRVVVCGGEERGTWLLEHGVASDRTFAFALALTRTAPTTPLGRVRLQPTSSDTGELALAAFADLLRTRQPAAGAIAPGWNWELAWS